MGKKVMKCSISELRKKVQVLGFKYFSRNQDRGEGKAPVDWGDEDDVEFGIPVEKGRTLLREKGNWRPSALSVIYG